MKTVRVVGGGLAGTEAAYQLLKRGFGVELYEMRPTRMTPAHKTGELAELVCSNSLKSTDVGTAQGLLKKEMSMLGAMITECASRAAVPAGGALAVDREAFSREVERTLSEFDNFRLLREEVTEITPDTVIATGPLTSDKLYEAIDGYTGGGRLHFYDAVAPIVSLDSVDMSKAFYSSRYGKGSADYLNCPMSREEYEVFVGELVGAERVILRDFEKGDVFEGCMPVEVMAARGADALRFGPLRPVGIRDSEGNRFYAIVQLRAEDREGKLANIVGFQTNLTFPEQRRVFGLIPALRDAEFVRYGVMHRNTFLNAPGLLGEDFMLKGSNGVYFAGQMTGVEGYMESAMSGMIAGISLARRLLGKPPITFPATTMCGSLAKYVAEYPGEYQPMHVSFALVPPLEANVKGKKERKLAYAERAIADLGDYLEEIKEV